MNLVSLQNLEVGYSHSLISGFSSTISDGDFILLSGPNGSGKSTLLKTILNQIPELSGEVIKKEGLTEAFLPQINQTELLFSLTIEEFLDAYEVPVMRKELISKKVRSKLWQHASGGEKQKAMILSRISEAIDVLYLDEPFNHLDEKSMAETIHFLIDLLQKKELKAVIAISHQELGELAYPVKRWELA